MMALFSFGMAFVGFALMGLSQSEHYRWAFGQTLPRSRAHYLRIAGVVLIGASIVPAASAWGWAFGSVSWFGLLSLAAAILLIIRTYLPSRAARAAASTLKKQGNS